MINDVEGECRYSGPCDLRYGLKGAPATGGWIDSNEYRPELIQGKDYSENVWGYDPEYEKILVVCLFVESDGEWFWCNCYGEVFGDGKALLDDAYNIKYWQPIAIPEKPNID